MSSLWVGIATVAVSAGSAAASYSQSSKANKANKQNQQAFNEATIANEAEARKLFDGFISDYNKSKEKLNEGMTLQEYIGNMVQALGNPQLEEAYRKARNGDWEQAQQFADAANKQNVSAFNMIVDSVSGGDYQKLIKSRNNVILSENVDSLYKEARRLSAPKQAAGSVVKNPDGTVVDNQRGDKFQFSVAETAIRQQNDRTFQMGRTAIEDDRAAAARQQDKAIQFLPMLDYSGFTANNVVQPYNQAKLQSQLAQLQIDAGLASQAMGAATGAPVAPPVINTAAYDANASQATQQTIAALASLYKTQAANNGTQAAMTQSRANTVGTAVMGSSPGTVY